MLAWIHVRHVRRVTADRRDTFAPIEAVLTDVEVTQDGLAYPTARGRYAGRDVKLELIVDTLTMRQLPRLWLAATVLRPLPLRDPVDIVLRPLATDIVSPGARFAYEHPPFPTWPEHLRVTAPCETPLPRLGDVEVLGELLRDARTKSVLMAPGGVRVVTELARGDVARHRVLRRPDFDAVLDPQRLRRLLDDELELAEDVSRVAEAVA